MTIRGTQALAAAQGLGDQAPNLDDLLISETETGLAKAYTVGSLASLLGASQPVVPTYDIKSFGAVGDGVTNDTAAFQDAVSTSNPAVIIISPGRYLVDRIDIPYRSIAIVGVNKSSCIIEGRTPGQDVFRMPIAGDIGATRPALTRQFYFGNMTIVINVGSLTNQFQNFTRAGVNGQAIGPCGITMERTNFRNDSGGNSSNIRFTWGPLFGTVDNIDFKIKGSSTSHFSAAVYHKGNSYGWRWRRLRVKGPDYGVMTSPSFMHRVTVAGNVVTTVGGNQIISNRNVLVRGHSVSGSQPVGLSRNQLTTSAATGTKFNVNDNGSGGSNVYAMISGPGGQVFSPDETYIEDFRMVGGRFGVSIPDGERLTINGLRTTGTRGCLEVLSFPSVSSRVEPETCQFHGVHANFKNAETFSDEPAIEIEGRACVVSSMSVTGSKVPGAGRPRVVFAGEDLMVRGFKASADASQAGREPRIELLAANGFIRGAAHEGCQFSLANFGDWRGRLKRKTNVGGSNGNFHHSMGNWS